MCDYSSLSVLFHQSKSVYMCCVSGDEIFRVSVKGKKTYDLDRAIFLPPPGPDTDLLILCPIYTLFFALLIIC